MQNEFDICLKCPFLPNNHKPIKESFCWIISSFYSNKLRAIFRVELHLRWTTSVYIRRDKILIVLLMNNM